MESLLMLKEMLLSGDFICKIDTEDAYIAVSFSKTPKNRSGSNRKTCYANVFVYTLDFL